MAAALFIILAPGGCTRLATGQGQTPYPLIHTIKRGIGPL